MVCVKIINSHPNLVITRLNGFRTELHLYIWFKKHSKLCYFAKVRCRNFEQLSLMTETVMVILYHV